LVVSAAFFVKSFIYLTVQTPNLDPRQKHPPITAVHVRLSSVPNLCKTNCMAYLKSPYTATWDLYFAGYGTNSLIQVQSSTRVPLSLVDQQLLGSAQFPLMPLAFWAEGRETAALSPRRIAATSL
jgi:hypothetical protein